MAIFPAGACGLNVMRVVVVEFRQEHEPVQTLPARDAERPVRVLWRRPELVMSSRVQMVRIIFTVFIKKSIFGKFGCEIVLGNTQ